MTEQELMQEALEWREHIAKLAADCSDQELFRKRLATFEWLIEQAERVQELEDFKRSAEQLYKNYHLSAKRSVAEKEELREQNERYQDMLVKIFKIVQNHQIMKISDEDYADAATILYKWIYDTGAIDHEKHFSELHGHDEFDSHQISLLLKKHIDKESSKALEESK